MNYYDEEERRKLNELLSSGAISSDGAINGIPNQTLAALMADNSEQGVQFNPTFQQGEMDRNREQFAREDVRAAERGYNPQQFQTPQAPAQPAAPAAPQPQNWIQRSGGEKISLDQFAGNRPHDPFRDGPEILGRQRTPDGGEMIIKRVAGLDGFGRQSARVVQEFVPPPDMGRMKQAAEIQKLQAETRKADRIESPKLPEKAQLFHAYQSMPDGPAKEDFGRMIGAAEGPGVKLKPGERYNTTTGEIELVPGSEAWRKQNAAETKAAAGDKALTDSFTEVARRVSDLETKGYDAATGWWDAMAPVWMSIAPGDKSDARSRVKNLQEYLQTKGLLDLRKAGVAPGSVTEREWSKFASMIGNVDPELSDKAFGEELNRIKTLMQSFIPNQKAEPSAARSGQVQTGQSANITTDAQYNALPSGAVFVGPDGKKRRKP